MRVAAANISTPQQVLRLRGEGMPVHGVPSEFGDLLVTLHVDFPTALSARQAELVRAEFGSGGA